MTDIRDVTPDEARRLARVSADPDGTLEDIVRNLAAQVERLNAEIETIEADQGRKMNAMYQRAAAAESQVARLTAERDALRTGWEQVAADRIRLEQAEKSVVSLRKTSEHNYRKGNEYHATLIRIRAQFVDLRMRGCTARQLMNKIIEVIEAIPRDMSKAEASPTSPLPRSDQPV